MRVPLMLLSVLIAAGLLWSSLAPSADAASSCTNPLNGEIDLTTAKTSSSQGYHAKFTVIQSDGDSTTWSASGGFDFDGDEFLDFIVGHQGQDFIQPDQGAAFIVLGPVPTGSYEIAEIGATVDGYRLYGPVQADAWAGKGLAAGDFDGDSCPDLVIGSPNFNTNKGAAHQIQGSCGFAHPNVAIPFEATYHWDSITDPERYGSAVATGNLDQDATDEIVVGAPYLMNSSGSSRAGRVHLYESGILGAGPHIRFDGEGTNDHAGHSVAADGDFDSDGCNDLLIGAYGAATSTVDKGAAYLIYQPTRMTKAGLQCLGFTPLGVFVDLSLVGTTIAGVKFHGEMSNAKAGGSVAFAGDVNGDGYEDILVGSYGYSTASTAEGAVYLIYGDDPGTRILGVVDLGAVVGSYGARFEGTGWQEKVGIHVAGVGDIDDDGNDDIFIGTQKDRDSTGATSQTGSTGNSYLVYGRYGGGKWSGSYYLESILASSSSPPIAYFKGAQHPRGIRAGSAEVGDVTDNGYSDLVITSSVDEDNLSGGMVYVVEGDCR